MDAYHKGLNGVQAAWANKKYRGHRVLPETLMEEMDAANIPWTSTSNTYLLVFRLASYYIIPWERTIQY